MNAKITKVGSFNEDGMPIGWAFLGGKAGIVFGIDGIRTVGGFTIAELRDAYHAYHAARGTK